MPSKDLSESVQQKILEEFKSNPDVFEQVYNHYYEMILRYLLKRTMSAEIAYDLTADTFIRAFESLGKFKWTGVSIKVWLYRIAINSLKNYRRNPRTSPLSDVPEGHEGLTQDVREELKELDKAMFGDDDLAKLSDAMATLKPEQQNVLSLYYYDGFSQKEISDVTKKSVSSIKSLMFRATLNLRRILSPNFI
jgi:RNA polymerase sigma-70 factor, ECF subfamily